VQDYADVSADILAKAEAEARRVFQQGGVQTTWLNCSPKLELEKIESANCALVDSTHLILKIVQMAKNTQINDASMCSVPLIRMRREPGTLHMSSMTAFKNLPNGEGLVMHSWPM